MGNNSHIDWDDIPTFLALLRGGSLSAAAREMGVEHATIARRISRLEQQLDLRLFDRLPRGWQPTPEARAMQVDAQAAERAMQQLDRRARGANRLQGNVSLSAPPLLFSSLLIAPLSGFLKANPQLNLSVDSADQRRNLQEGQVDLALRIGALEGQTLRAAHLADVTYRPYRTGSVKAVIQPEGRNETFAWMHAWAQDRPVALKTGHVPTILSAAKAGLGIAILPDFLARQHEELSPVGTAFLSRPLYLAMHEDKANSPRVRHVADALKSVVKSLKSQLAL